MNAYHYSIILLNNVERKFLSESLSNIIALRQPRPHCDAQYDADEYWKRKTQRVVTGDTNVHQHQILLELVLLVLMLAATLLSALPLVELHRPIIVIGTLSQETVQSDVL